MGSDATDVDGGRFEAWRAPLPPPETILSALESSKTAREREVLSFLLTQPPVTGRVAGTFNKGRTSHESIPADGRTSKRASRDELESEDAERLTKPKVDAAADASSSIQTMSA